MKRSSCLSVFFISFLMMMYSFLFSKEIKEGLGNGFIVFMVTDFVWVLSCFLFIGFLLSIVSSLVYMIVRGDPDLKKLALGMFSFFIWDEIK